MTVKCMQCCGERKTIELAIRDGGMAENTTLPEMREAVTWVPTPQGVVPTCYEHVAVIRQSPLLGPNGVSGKAIRQ